jgi:dTDP-glucose 4,6-dehydratase
MNILVTGGLGFIGSNFIQLILTKEPDVNIFNLDAITYAGNLANLKDYEQHPRYQFVKGNICNFELVDYMIEKYKIEYIINFAAESHVDRSISNPDIFIETNIKGTLALLNAAKKHKNQIKKYLQVSTDEVYGSLTLTDPAFNEQTPINPRSPYSASKASADMLVNAFHETFGLPTLITRCSNNYGPYQFPEKLIPLMIRNIQLNKPLPVYGDGKNVRDWIYVEDHCSGIWSTLMNGKVGQVYNFGGNAEKQNIQIIRLLLEHLKKGEELISYVKDRPGHDLRYAMDFSKAKKELNWTPKYDFETGMQKTIQWYLDNQPWVENIITGEYLAYYQKQYGK